MDAHVFKEIAWESLRLSVRACGEASLKIVGVASFVLALLQVIESCDCGAHLRLRASVPQNVWKQG